jgi:hypothetical protein
VSAAMRIMEPYDTSLEDVRYYLRAWRWRTRQWAPNLGYPTQSPTVHLMRPVVSWDSTEDPNASADEAYDQVSTFIVQAVDRAVDELPTDQRAAVKLTYLREVDYAVYRSGRKTMEEVRRLCDAAEKALIPLLRARHVVLGGR